MIYVVLGTQKHEFKRLVKYIEKMNKSLIKDQKIIIQLGETKYNIKDSNITCLDYDDNYLKHLKEAKLIICHGGVGTIMEALNYNKKIIAIPRLKKNNEHVNDHQEEICNKLANNKNIYIANNYEQLIEQYDREFEVKQYNFNNEYFNEKLNELLLNMK